MVYFQKPKNLCICLRSIFNLRCNIDTNIVKNLGTVIKPICIVTKPNLFPNFLAVIVIELFNNHPFLKTPMLTLNTGLWSLTQTHQINFNSRTDTQTENYRDTRQRSRFQLSSYVRVIVRKFSVKSVI